MLDPRIYRSGLIAIALAIVVAAFSVQSQPPALGSPLAPDAFSGQSAYKMARQLAAAEPVLTAGSDGDQALAKTIQQQLQGYGFASSVDAFRGQTSDGPRQLENVVGVRPGMQTGTVVVVAPRDAAGTPSTPADTSATATLIELARDLEGETLNRTVMLASVSGSRGEAGALRLASRLSGPVDAVIVLGDMAGSHARQPIVVPWSQTSAVAPAALRNTLALALDQQAALGVRPTGLGGQFVHLAFPFTVSGQAPFDAHGYPAVLVSMSGQGSPSPAEPLGGAAMIGSLGRAVLQTISALESAPAVASPSAYLVLDGKLVPGWALSLVALALIVPVLLCVLDACARTTRRHRPVWRWGALGLAAVVPFLVAVAILPAARLAGLVPVAPPVPVSAGASSPGVGGSVTLALAALAALAGLAVVARPAVALVRREGGTEGAVAPLLALAVAATLAIWAMDPYAALLLVPALHLWLVALSPRLGLRAPVRVGLVVAGLTPLALAALYYAVTLGYGGLGLIWAGALLVAGGGVAAGALLAWSAFAGCVAGALAIAALATRERRRARVPVTVRGPVSYAGPGSLGGTESALRR